MQENELVARPEISKLSELETTVGHRNLPTRVFAGQLNQLLKGLWSGPIFLPYVTHHNVVSLKRMGLLKEIINLYFSQGFSGCIGTTAQIWNLTYCGNWGFWSVLNAFPKFSCAFSQAALLGTMTVNIRLDWGLDNLRSILNCFIRDHMWLEKRK